MRTGTYTLTFSTGKHDEEDLTMTCKIKHKHNSVPDDVTPLSITYKGVELLPLCTDIGLLPLVIDVLETLLHDGGYIEELAPIASMLWKGGLRPYTSYMTKAETLQDAALGCLLGACVGDAAGAVLEGIGRKPSLPEVNRAMTMPGGGYYEVAPGQITDDGELTLCLAQALSKNPTFQIEKIAQKYNDWVSSRPFDMGITTHHSLGCYKGEMDLKRKGYAGVMAGAANSHCMSSKANGSLMRITPLGIWGHKFSDDKLAEFAQADSKLSHPNPSCLYAVSCYVIAIASLMRNLGDRKGAFERAKQWADANANEEVRGWLADAQDDVDVSYYPQAGFVKIGFTHAFRHLWLGTDYVEAIKETLLGGGDTDTNACIIGGLIGAASGAGTIPETMRNAVLHCDTQKNVRIRPSFLHTTQIPEFVEGLIVLMAN